MDFFRRLAQQLRDVWAGMSAARRTLFVAVALLLAALVAGAFYYRSSQTDWAVLYSNLTPDDAQAIHDKLQSQGVPVRVSSDKRTVEVPAERVGPVRIDLAGQGLPATAKGYELFDEPSLAATPFREQVNLLRAKQAVIAKTIRGLEPVANATVEIAKAEPSPFLRERQPTTAAVQVTLRPGATLNRAQVNGIVAFVSKSVEGLSPENVTVVDSKGNQLSEPGGAEAGAVASQLDYRRAVESYLAEKATTILIPALGPGRAVVKVTADINFQHRKEVKDTISPDQKAVTHEKTTTRNSTTSGAGARGVAGARSNLASPVGTAGAGGGGGTTSTTKDEESDTSYDYPRTRTEVEDRLGGITRLTVAATVDLTPADGSKPPLTPQAVEGLIKGAIGFDDQRGDSITVTEAKLTSAAPPPTAEAPPEGPPAVEWWRNPEFFAWVWRVSLAVAVVLLALVMVLIAWLLIRGPRAPAVVVPVPEREMPAMRPVTTHDPEALARAIAALMEQP